MKTIFVYGILQKGESAKSFGLKDEYWKGRARLDGYTRYSLTSIYKGHEDDKVFGDVFEVPDELEESLYRFEKQYGYYRGNTYPKLSIGLEPVKCISYLLPEL